MNKTQGALQETRVSSPKVACDGGIGALGHPKVYLTIDQNGYVDCPYCGHRFTLIKNSSKQ